MNQPTKEDIEQMKKDSKIIENAYINSKTDRAKECCWRCKKEWDGAGHYCPKCCEEFNTPEQSECMEDCCVQRREFSFSHKDFISKKELRGMLEGRKHECYKECDVNNMLDDLIDKLGLFEAELENERGGE